MRNGKLDVCGFEIKEFIFNGFIGLEIDKDEKFKFI